MIHLPHSSKTKMISSFSYHLNQSLTTVAVLTGFDAVVAWGVGFRRRSNAAALDKISLLCIFP